MFKEEGAIGSPLITISTPGFIDGSASVDIVQPGVSLENLLSSLDVFLLQMKHLM